MKKCIIIINKYFYFMLFLMMIIGFTANYHGNEMSGILHYYDDYSRLIRSSFNISIEYPTFPMWGYGFILAITKNKLVIIILQFCITFFVIYALDQIAQQVFKTAKIKIFFRISLLLSFPWFSFNSNLWPYSIAANLTIFSLIFLYKYFYYHKDMFLIISACLFGVVLNFRSDYYLYPLFLSILLIGYKIFSWENKSLIRIKVHHIFLWLILIYSFLIPYAIYAHTTIGHYIVTSTNSGHVFFIGLGQLPNNKWGITPYDGDPKMAEIMKEEFGQESYGRSIQYDGDKVLKKRFLDIIKKDPKEYLKKIFYSAYLMLKGGFYYGEYLTWFTFGETIKVIHLNIKESLKELDFRSVLQVFQKAGLFFSLLYCLWKSIGIFSRFLFIFFNFSLFFYIFRKFFKSNNFISIIFLSIVFYQYALCIFAYYMPCYVTNLYLIYLFFIFLTIDCYIKNKMFFLNRLHNTTKKSKYDVAK